MVQKKKSMARYVFRREELRIFLGNGQLNNIVLRTITQDETENTDSVTVTTVYGIVTAYKD